MKLKQNGVYILKEEFFEKYNDKYLSVNKGKGRPFYYVLSDKKVSGIYWVVPLTSQMDKVNKSIGKFGGNEADCPYYVINYGIKNSAFNIGNIFPTLEKYIEREYINKFSGTHLIIKNTSIISSIEKKASRLIRKNLQIEIKNSVDIKKFLPLLQNELQIDKTKNYEIKVEKEQIIVVLLNDKPYNPMTGKTISLCPGSQFSDKYKSAAWLSKGQILKNQDKITIKDCKIPFKVRLFSRNVEKQIVMKDILFYNTEQLLIDKELIKEFKEPIKTVEKEPVIKEKDSSWER